MKNAINNQVGMLGDMFLWLVANLKQGVIYFIKQALPPNISAGSVFHESSKSIFFSKNQNKAEFKYLDDSTVLSRNFPDLRASAVGLQPR